MCVSVCDFDISSKLFLTMANESDGLCDGISSEFSEWKLESAKERYRDGDRDEDGDGEKDNE